MPSIFNFSGLADNETELEPVTKAVLSEQGCVLPFPKQHQEHSKAEGAGMAPMAQDPFSTWNMQANS